MVKTPPDTVNFSNLNVGLTRSLSLSGCFSSLAPLLVGNEKFVREKFAEMGFGAGGQRVISVALVTEWNFARERGVFALVGPECRIMSGRAVLIGDVGLSFWIVM